MRRPRWEVAANQVWQCAGAAGAVAVVVVLWLLRNHIGRGPLVAVLFFVGSLVPALGFVNVYPMLFSFVADHFEYHASIGLIALGAALVVRAMKRIVIWSIRAMIALLIIAPLGLVLRMVGHDPLRRRLNRHAKSHWSNHARAPDKGRYFRQF